MPSIDVLREKGVLTRAQALAAIEEVAVGDDDRFTALHTMLLSGVFPRFGRGFASLRTAQRVASSISSRVCFAEGVVSGVNLRLVRRTASLGTVSGVNSRLARGFALLVVVQWGVSSVDPMICFTDGSPAQIPWRFFVGWVFGVEHNDYDGAGNAIQGVELHMPKMFGTDGVRGLANRDLTARLALDLGDAAVRVLGDAGTQDDQPEGRRRALVA